MLVHNNSDYDTYDRNGDGRLLARAHAHMLKSGKFEGGLDARMHVNFVHFHRRRPDGTEEANVFPQMLQLLLVRFMNDDATAEVQRVETELNRSVRNLLAEMRINEPDQTGHSESRRIIGSPPSRSVLERLLESAGTID